MENDNPKKAQEWYTDFDHLSLIHENNMPALTKSQSTLNYILNVQRAGGYIVVVDYITDRKLPETSIIRINLGGEDDKDGVVTLYPCTYTMVCRQPVIDAESREKVFWMDNNDLRPIEIVVSSRHKFRLIQNPEIVWKILGNLRKVSEVRKSLEILEYLKKSFLKILH